MSKKAIKNSTKPKMVLRLDTAKEPFLRNFLKFRTKPIFLECSAEYLTVMKRLEKQNGLVARFSMSRAVAPVIVLAQYHLIKQINRCCVSVTAQATRSVLCQLLRKSQ